MPAVLPPMQDRLSESEMEYSCFVVDSINTFPRIPGNPRLDVRTYLAHATSPLGSPTPLATILSCVHESLCELAFYAIEVLVPFGSFAFATLSLGSLLYLHDSSNLLSTSCQGIYPCDHLLQVLLIRCIIPKGATDLGVLCVFVSLSPPHPSPNSP